MRTFDAVIFDWSGTLVHDPPLRDRVRAALRTLGRVDDDVVTEVCASLLHAEADPDVQAAQKTADTSLAAYEAAESLLFTRAGLPVDVAHALLHIDEDVQNRPLYPDALAVLEGLRTRGRRVVILSDIHFDIRPLLEQQGVAQYIDDYVLSFEEGLQKPDPRIFGIALERCGSARDRTLMVGDRSTHDGPANECGITTLLLPPLPVFGPRGLSIVDRLTA